MQRRSAAAQVSRFFCRNCPRNFSNAYTFNRHIESEICLRLGGGRRGRKRGGRRPAGRPRKEHVCDECGQRFARRQSLLTHKQRVHMNIKISFPCGICSRLFDSGKDLDEHRARAHERRRGFYQKKHALKNACQVCDSLSARLAFLYV